MTTLNQFIRSGIINLMLTSNYTLHDCTAYVFYLESDSCDPLL